MSDERIFGLIGRKLGHSDSVPIHEAFGLKGYRLFEMEPEEIEGFLNTPGLKGLNVTIPYKRAVIPFMDKLSPQARRVGSVNTIVFTEDGRRIGHNTDVDGVLYSLKKLGVDVRGKKALVFGSGGAGAAARAALETLGAGEIVTVSRTGENHYGNLDRHADASVLVNATPVGMFPNAGASVVDPARFPKAEYALDMVYNPLRTEFLRLSEQAGIACMNGLNMLVAQARRAEELFLNERIPDAENERVARLLFQNKTNIALVGMPGSGKSSVGALLGRLTGREVWETDAMIQAEAGGRSIPDIISAEGVAAFREREARAVWAASEKRGIILVTGGGAVLREENRRALRSNSRVYRLMRSVDKLPTEGRPLSQGVDLNKMCAEREPFYRMTSDRDVRNEGTPENTAREILNEFETRIGESYENFNH